MAKQLGVTEKTAWYMVHRLRQTLFNEYMDFSGIIEIDETYTYGKEAINHFGHKLVSLNIEPIYQDEDEVA